MKPVIQVENLTYQYPGADKPALRGINLAVEEGQTLGLIGSNGAGKSTLCYALMGLVPHFHRGTYAGHVVLDGVQVRSSNLGEMAEHAALVFQNPLNQFSGAKLTVEEEIAFGMENLGFDRELMHHRVQSVSRLLGIHHLLQRNPYQLSGGQMQRVAIASVLALRPKVLILDEPTSQLDPVGTSEVFQAIQTLQAEGMTTVIVEHKTELLAKYCHQIGVFQDGELTALAQPGELFGSQGGHVADDWGVEIPRYTVAYQGVVQASEPDRQSRLAPGETLVPVTLDETVCRLLERTQDESQVNELRQAQNESSPNESRLNESRLNEDANETTSVVQAYGRARVDSHVTRSGPVPAIRVENASFAYTPNHPVLTDISLSFAGGATAIIGQNGAGKTTLMKLLNGLLKPTTGKVVVGETDTALTETFIIARWVGLVFQNPDDQIFKHKVKDEVEFGPLNIGKSPQEAQQLALDALRAVGLEQHLNDNPYDLSYTDRKKVCVASVLAMNTDVVVFDEPTISQDAAGMNVMAQVIRDLVKAGKTVIAIVHDMNFAAENFDRIVVMGGGRVLADGSPEVVFQDHEALKAAHVEPPAMGKLSEAVGLCTFAITVDKFVKQFTHQFAGQSFGEL